MEKVTEYFGSMVFDERVMKATLSEKVYKSLKRTIDRGNPLDISVANAVAAAMKDWMLHPSPPAVSVLHSRQEVIRHGILPPTPS